MLRTAVIEIEYQGETVVFTPTKNLVEFEELELVAKEAVEVLSDPSINNLVIDFYKTDYFGSTTLGLFVRLWKTMEGRNGSMVFCSLSERQLEVLNVTKLDTLWPICESREQAMKAVGN